MAAEDLPPGTATAPRVLTGAEPGEVCAFHHHGPGTCAAAARGQVFPECCGCGARAVVAVEFVTGAAVVRVPFCAGHRGEAASLAAG